MSTRCYIGTGPLNKFKGFYIHHDGYPETKVPSLVAWLYKNSYSDFVKVVKKTRGAGGSSFDNSLDPNSLVDDPYNDGPDEHVGPDEALDQEYTYVVFKNKIDVYNMGDKLGTVKLDVPERKVVAHVFGNKLPKWIFQDGIEFVIGRVMYEESGIG